MATINHHSRELNFKIVYYGTGLGGKTSSLQYLHRALPPDTRGPLVMLPTSQDRTLYFDFLPLKLPEIRGYKTRLHLYTVPGQVHYNATRKLVLSGADAVIFVADSQAGRQEANIESLNNLVENLKEQQMLLSAVPWVIQYNKRDLPEVLPLEQMEADLNQSKVPSFETIATSGQGILDALKTIVRLMLTAYRESEAARDRTPKPLLAPATTPPAADPPPSPQTRRARGRLLEVPSLGEIAGALDSYQASGADQLKKRRPAREALPRYSLGQLTRSSGAAEAISAMEACITANDWSGAIIKAGVACHQLASTVSGSIPMGEAPADPLALACYLLGIPPRRYLRFREIEARVDQQCALSLVDALFALFFLTDFALYLDEAKPQG